MTDNRSKNAKRCKDVPFVSFVKKLIIIMSLVTRHDTKPTLKYASK